MFSATTTTTDKDCELYDDEYCSTLCEPSGNGLYFHAPTYCFGTTPSKACRVLIAQMRRERQARFEAANRCGYARDMENKTAPQVVRSHNNPALRYPGSHIPKSIYETLLDDEDDILAEFEAEMDALAGARDTDTDAEMDLDDDDDDEDEVEAMLAPKHGSTSSAPAPVASPCCKRKREAEDEEPKRRSIIRDAIVMPEEGMPANDDTRTRASKRARLSLAITVEHNRPPWPCSELGCSTFTLGEVTCFAEAPRLMTRKRKSFAFEDVPDLVDMDVDVDARPGKRMRTPYPLRSHSAHAA